MERVLDVFARFRKGEVNHPDACDEVNARIYAMHREDVEVLMRTYDKLQYDESVKSLVYGTADAVYAIMQPREE